VHACHAAQGHFTEWNACLQGHCITRKTCIPYLAIETTDSVYNSMNSAAVVCQDQTQILKVMKGNQHRKSSAMIA